MCLPQKPWFYDIWQTWVGYPFQVSSLASGQWPPGVPGISPLAGIIHSSLFPPHGHHLKGVAPKPPAFFREVLLTVAGLPPPARPLLFPPTPGHQFLAGDVIRVPKFSAELLHCSRSRGASRHSYFNDSALSHCLLVPVLGRGQEYK